MIGKLKGILESLSKDHLLIDVNGVCYTVFCSTKTLCNLPPQGQKISLEIETHVREDHIHLYGFMDKKEQEAFLCLNKVNGIGTRVALAILSSLSPKELAESILMQNKDIFKNIAGVGPKLAQRILTELKDVKAEFIIKSSGLENSIPEISMQDENKMHNAISGLTNLGYNYNDSYKIISKIISENKDLALDEIIRQGLKYIGKK